MCSSERVALLVPFLLAAKMGKLMKNSSSSGFRSFGNYNSPSNDDPVFLTLDSHGSNIFLRICNCHRDNALTVVYIPLHTSNRLQPLYLRLYGPLRAFMNKIFRLYLERNVREEITEFCFSELLKKCYLQAAALEKGTSISDFRAAGVSRLNSEMFREIEFETNKEVKND